MKQHELLTGIINDTGPRLRIVSQHLNTTRLEGRVMSAKKHKSNRSSFQDFTGFVFGRLTVLNFSHKNDGGHFIWRCKCLCGSGKIKEVRGDALRNGAANSCGCLSSEHAERIGRKRKTHGMSTSKAFYTWGRMIARCTNPKVERYKRYGGRGIAICDRWLHSFEAFLADMGPPPSASHSLDRIDNNKDYSPDNCRWATATQQARNKSNNVVLTHDGITATLPEWAEKTGLNVGTIRTRIFMRGWTTERALTTKPQMQRRI